MEMLNRKELKDLAENPKGPCVSIFMPTHFKGPETQQNPIRLKNLLREAEQRLVELEIRPAEARELLAPAAALRMMRISGNTRAMVWLSSWLKGFSATTSYLCPLRN